MNFLLMNLLSLLLTLQVAVADTPPPGTVKIKDTAGNAITTTGGALDVNISGGSIGGSVTVDNFPATQPISAVSLPLPAGAATEAGNLATLVSVSNAISAKLGTLGQKTMSGSSPVTIASDQSSLPVTGTFWQATQPVSGVFFQATQPVSAVALPLPSGASTSAAQATGNASLSSIEAKILPPGQAAAASSSPVVIASDQSPIPITGSITATNPSVGANSAAVPASSTQVAGKDGSGNLQPVKVSAAGVVSVDGSASTQPVSGTFWQVTQPVSVSSLPLPTGASTAANQSTANASLSSIDSKLTSPLAVTGSFFQSTQPVSASSLPLPAGAATAANQSTANASLSSIDGKLTSPLSVNIVSGGGTNPSVSATGAAVPASATYLGVKNGTDLVGLQASGAGLLVDGSAVTQPVSGTFWQATQPVSGTFFQATQPVSAAALPLPAGASTAANQSTGNSTLGAIDTKLGGTLLVDGSAVTQPVSGTVAVSNFPGTQAVTGTFFQATQPVSAAALPLPAGASTSANQGTANASLSSIDGKTPALGQAAMVASSPVVIASDQSAIPITGSITASNSANGATGSTVPGDATQVGGVDGSGDLRALKVSTAGVLSVDNSANTQPVSASSLPLPSGASTAADQATGNASLGSIDGKLSGTILVDGSGHTQPVSGTVTANAGTGTFLVDGSAVTQPVSGTFWQATQPVSAAALPLPTGASTAAKQPALGVAGTASADVLSVQGIAGMTALIVDGSAVTQPVSGSVSVSNFPATQPISGSVSVTGTVTVDGSGVTQPISAAALPLPAGAATAANQSTANGSLSSIDSKVPANLTVSSTRLLVDSSGVTQPISASSLPLPTGAASAANQATALASLSSIDSKLTSPLAVTGTFFQATQPVSAAALPLPSGASTAAKQPALGTAGTPASDVITVQGAASMTALKVDGSAVTQPVSIAAAVSTKAPVNTNGSMATVTTIGTTAATITAPANAVGFVLEASSSNAQNLRWAIGATASTTSGLRLEPGRDTGYIPGAANISIVAEAGTNQEYQIQWILSQ